MKYKIKNNDDIEIIEIFDERWYRVNYLGTEYNLPSVTTYLEAMPKEQSFLEWYRNVEDPNKIRDDAADFGSLVHKAIQTYLTNGSLYYRELDIQNETLKVQIWERFLQWFDWHKEQQFENVGVEYICWDIELNYAGTIDYIAKKDDKFYLFDWKTGNHIYNTAYLQLSAYQKAFEKETGILIDKSFIMQINPKLNSKGWRLTEVTEVDYYFEIFQSIQKIWNFQNKNPKPKYKTLPMFVQSPEFAQSPERTKSIRE